MSARADRVLFGVSQLPRRHGLHAGAETHLCVACRKRRALFRYRGVVKADADHTLCFRCYRALRNRLRPAYAWAVTFRVNTLTKEMK